MAGTVAHSAEAAPVPRPKPEQASQVSNPPSGAATQESAPDNAAGVSVADDATEPDNSSPELPSDQAVARLPAARPQPSEMAAAVPEEEPEVRVDTTLLPRPKPDGYIQIAQPPYGFPPADDLARALNDVGRDDYSSALARASKLDDPLDRKIVEWAVARAPKNPMSVARIQALRETMQSWPDQDRLQLRAEQALMQSNPSPDDVISFFADERPTTQASRSLSFTLR